MTAGSPRLVAPRWALALALAGTVGLLALLFAGCVLGFVYLAPALLLSTVLLLGRFPGEHRLVAAVRRPSCHRQARTVEVRGRPRTHVPRGGRLVAARLAGRAPPWADIPA